MKLTTTRLTLPRARFDGLPLPMAIGIVVFCLFLIVGLLGKIHSAPAVTMQPTPALSYIILGTSAPAPPTATPAQPTPDQQVYQELAALRARVAELEAAQAAPQPQVVYVQAPPVVEAAPTPAPEQYQAMSAPPTMVPQTQAILDRGAWASTAATAQAGR